MPKGDFLKEFWKYKKEGGNLSMKEYSAKKKEKSAEEPKKEGEQCLTTEQTKTPEAR